jgi:hypothetical protein
VSSFGPIALGTIFLRLVLCGKAPLPRRKQNLANRLGRHKDVQGERRHLVSHWPSGDTSAIRRSPA